MIDFQGLYGQFLEEVENQLGIYFLLFDFNQQETRLIVFHFQSLSLNQNLQQRYK